MLHRMLAIILAQLLPKRLPVILRSIILRLLPIALSKLLLVMLRRMIGYESKFSVLEAMQSVKITFLPRMLRSSIARLLPTSSIQHSAQTSTRNAKSIQHSAQTSARYAAPNPLQTAAQTAAQDATANDPVTHPAPKRGWPFGYSKLDHRLPCQRLQ